MKTIGLALILVLLTYYLGSCQSLPTKKDQYDFLKWYLKTKEPKLLSKTIIRFDENMIVLRSISPDSNDVNYIEKQMDAYRENALLDTSLLKGNHWSVMPDTSRLSIRLSLPIFSINKKFAAIHWETDCGWQCGGDHIEVYERNKAGEWVVSKRRIQSIYQ